MNRFTLAFCLVLAAALPSPASACGGAGVALIHHTLPTSIPDNAIVAEVELMPDFELRSHEDIRARVIRPIRATTAPFLILRRQMTTSCDVLFGNGSTGIVVAIPTGNENGVPVVDPIMAPVRPSAPRPVTPG